MSLEWEDEEDDTDLDPAAEIESEWSDSSEFIVDSDDEPPPKKGKEYNPFMITPFS